MDSFSLYMFSCDTQFVLKKNEQAVGQRDSWLHFFDIVEKPSIDLSKIKDITVHAGQDIKIALPLKGWPVPTAAWKVGDNDITKDDRTKIEVRQKLGSERNRMILRLLSNTVIITCRFCVSLRFCLTLNGQL